jgi:hypothetical protein
MSRSVRRIGFCVAALFLFGLLWRADSLAKDNFGALPRDRGKPVATRPEIIAAWRKRTETIQSFRFAWTERQIHPKGWIPNPRFPEREWLNIPGLRRDRTYTVSKTLSVDGNKMRYAFELNRPSEPDGVIIMSPTGDTTGFGEGRHYSYVSVFDGQSEQVRLTLLNGDMPPTAFATTSNVDAQDLDTRPIMMALRPLDPVMGHLLVDRAVPNEGRRIFKGRSTMILEERRDPSGWKTSVWIEPERDFLVNRYHVCFEQQISIEIDVDYVQDARWGWIPNAWTVSEMLADGKVHRLTEARVTSYAINELIAAEEFRAAP